MVVSLYICEIPPKIGKNILEDLFHDLDGYKEMRIKGTKDRRIIAFVDFSREEDAKIAMNTFQGFKFSEEDKGLIIKFSDNSKSGLQQSKREREREEYLLGRKRKYSTDRIEKDRHNNSSRKRYKSYSRSPPSSSISSKGINDDSINKQNNIGNFLFFFFFLNFLRDNFILFLLFF